MAPSFPTAVQVITHNVTNSPGNGSTITSPDDSPPNLVSWQSVFWPIIAGTLNVMLQNTGRVCHTSFDTHSAWRSSPFICIVDTFFMLVEFVSMLFAGCSVRVAARHVWYDRFEQETEDNKDLSIFLAGPARQPISISVSENRDHFPHQSDTAVQMPLELLGPSEDQSGSRNTPGPSTSPTSPINIHNEQGHDLEIEPTGDVADNTPSTVNNATENEDTERSQTYPGSAINGTWKLNMIAFILGTLPQAIKVFGMRGIPFTQVIMGFLLVSFLIPEIFRIVAGTAGKFNLHPMPIVLLTKKILRTIQLLIIISFCIIYPISIFYLLVEFLVQKNSMISFWVVYPLVLTLLTGWVIGSCFRHLSKLAFFRSMAAMLQCSGSISELLTKLWSSSVSAIARIIALKPSVARVVSPLLVLYILVTAFMHSIVYIQPIKEAMIGIEDSPVLVRNNFIAWVGTIILTLLFFSHLCLPACIILPFHLLYRLTFMGSLSSRPRKYFGAKGSTSEFVYGTFVLFNFTAVLLVYCWFHDPRGTYKPRWTDKLG